MHQHGLNSPMNGGDTRDATPTNIISTPNTSSIRYIPCISRITGLAKLAMIPCPMPNNADDI